MDEFQQASLRAKFAEADGPLRALLDRMPVIFYVDAPGDPADTIYISPQLETILGYKPEEWIGSGERWSQHLHPDDRDWVIEETDRCARTGEDFRAEYRLTARDGATVWVHDEAVVVRENISEPYWQGVMVDITGQKERERRLDFMAHNDRLTGLPNRELFEEMLDAAIARARRSEAAVAVLVLDIDDFKLVNDSLGHAAGDELLAAVATRLRELAGPSDFLARQGGDEFLVLLPDIPGQGIVPGPDMDHALLVAESFVARIQRALETAFSLGGTDVIVTASVGISMFPSAATDARVLLKHADAAMYRSKAKGPGGSTIWVRDRDEPTGRLSMTTRLRRAVEQRDWEMHYQPIVELTTGQMLGVEALLRWNDVTGGLIHPGEFVPLAEDIGLIDTIGDWVIDEVFARAGDWHARGVALDVSLNLSPRQLWQPDLKARLLGSLRQHGADPAQIVLEVTESTAMIDPERTTHVLWELSRAGLRFAIDDFGTGYSSLARLKHLPITMLKIDRTFVTDLDKEQAADDMVRTMVQLAHTLSMEPLAEGIETAGQLERLIGAGCRLGQGYLLAAPVQATEVEQLVHVDLRHRDGVRAERAGEGPTPLG